MQSVGKKGLFSFINSVYFGFTVHAPVCDPEFDQCAIL